MTFLKVLTEVLVVVFLSGCGGAYVYGGGNPNAWKEFSEMQQRAREARAQQTPAEEYANSQPLNLQTHRVYNKKPKEVLGAVVDTFSRDHSNSTIRTSQGVMTVEWQMSVGRHSRSVYSMQTLVRVEKIIGDEKTRLILRTSYHDRLVYNDRDAPSLAEIDARLYNYVECYLYRHRDCR